MKNRILRLALVVLAVAGQAAAGFFVFRREQALPVAARSGVVALTRDAARVQSMIGEMRGAQAGMVGDRPGPGFWVPKVGGARPGCDGPAECDRPRPARRRGGAGPGGRHRGAGRVRPDHRPRPRPARQRPTAHRFLAGLRRGRRAPVHRLRRRSPASRPRRRRPSNSEVVEAAAARGVRAARRRGVDARWCCCSCCRASGVPEPESADARAARRRPGPVASAGRRPSDVDALGQSGFDLDIPRAAAGPRAIRCPSSRTNPRWRSSTTCSASRSCA